jgi:glycosyltransferase involved in cell wall biosynthesis
MVRTAADAPALGDARSFSAFYCFRDSPQRRAALSAAPGASERYLLFGLDQSAAQGVHVRHNLEQSGPSPGWARLVDRGLNWTITRAGGHGGTFQSILPSLRTLNCADVVCSTVDTVGLPLVLLRKARLVRPPLVYVSIGLPERMVKLGGGRATRSYLDALRRVTTFVTYSEHEAELLRGLVGESGVPPVVFVPFGVDVDFFAPVPGVQPDADVVSVGADPHRDFALLLRIAERQPGLRFRIVASRDTARELTRLPPNVELEVDIPFRDVRDRLARGRVVALPVRANSYSGATTVLLQSLALGKPVVVSRTQAIATGYGLVDGENCLLVEPFDEPAFERALLDLLGDSAVAERLGAQARLIAELELSWERYSTAMVDVIADAVGRS